MTHVSAWLAGGLAARASLALAGLRDGLRWASAHTGLPIAVVAAVGIVVSWRVFRHSLRFALEVAVATALLLLATELGLLHW